MALTPDQLATYSADIAANTDPTVVAALAEGNHEGITNWYNENAEPDFWVFFSSVPKSALIANINWAVDYAALKDDMEAIAFLFSDAGTPFDPRPEKARDALDVVTQGAPTTKNALIDIVVRQASYIEKLFAVPATGLGGGNGSAKLSSANAVFEGAVTVDDTRIAVAMIP